MYMIYIVLIFKYIYVVTSVINLCNYIHNYTINQHLNLPIAPNLSLTLPIYHLNSS